MQILLGYALIEEAQNEAETSSYAIHPMIHEWCFEMNMIRASNKNEIASLATAVIGSACFSIDDINSADSSPLHQNRLLNHCTHLHSLISKYPQHFARNARWDPTICFAYSSIGNFFSRSHGRLKEAEAMFLLALTEEKGNGNGDGGEGNGGGEDTASFKTMNNLALLYDKQGDVEKAEEMYLRALKGKEKVGNENGKGEGEDKGEGEGKSDDDMASTFETVHNLGVFYKFQGKTEKAEEMFLRALTGKEKTLGLHHKSTLKTIHQLGTLWMNQNNNNKTSKAETFYLRAIAAVKHHHPHPHPSSKSSTAS